MHRFFWFIAGETVAQRTGCLWDLFDCCAMHCHETEERVQSWSAIRVVEEFTLRVCQHEF